MICGKCGKELNGEFQFCPYCGAVCAAPAQPVLEEQSQELPSPRKKNGKKKVILPLVAAFTVLALVLGIGGWFMLAGGKETVYLRTEALEYTSGGMVISMTQYEYDEQGRLLKYTEDWGTPAEVFNAEMGCYQYVYGKIDGTIDVYRGFEYDDQGNLIRFERKLRADSEPQVNQYDWEYEGDTVETIEWNSGLTDTDVTMHTESFSYDDHGNLTELYYVNAEGRKHPAFMLDYDSEGCLTQYIKMSREVDLIYDFCYNKDGLVSEYIVSRATPTYYVMNEYSDIVEEQHLYLHYTDSGDLEEIASEGGAYVYRFEYDEQGRVISKECGTEVYTFSYDGNRATPSEGTLTDHEGNTKTYIYDKNGCLTKVQNADGSYTRYEYQELSLTKEEAEKFYRQQQMQLRSPVYLDWAYLSYENPWDYLIPTPINPALFTGPATVSGNGNEM